MIRPAISRKSFYYISIGKHKLAMAAARNRTANVITTDIPKVHRRLTAKRAAVKGASSAHHHFSAVAVKSAHPLFPPDQVFLWLPGLPGDQVAHCTYNECRDNQDPSVSRRGRRLPVRDTNHASFAPPYRVSAESFIAWHTGVTPPFPFHPVPIARTLGAAELEALGRRVHLLVTNNADAPSNPLQVLRNSCKCFVLAALAEMGYLAGQIPRPC